MEDIDSIRKAKSLNFYYSSVFRCESRIWQIGCGNSYEPFAISTEIIRSLAAIDKNKSVKPDKVSGQILKLGGETLIPCLARLLDTTINNAIILSDWKKAQRERDH
jgi:hypothetical protein